MGLVRSDNRRVPALRLEGFEGEWERMTIGDVFDERVEAFPEGELLSVTTSSGIKKFSEVGRHDTSNVDKSKYRRVEIGDIAYNSMRMWQGASGRSPYLGIVSPAYTVLAPKEGVCTGFFARLFKNEGMIQTFEKNSQGLTSDTWSLKYPALSRIEVSVPVAAEQKAISEVFDHVELMISSTTDRVLSLTSLKKTMLVKMFPQGAASTPEVRFEGFEGDWERAEFGDIFTHLSTNTLSRGDLTPSGDGVLNVHYGDVLVKFGNVLDVGGGGVPAISNVGAVNRLPPESFLRDGDVVIADTAEDDSVGKATEISGVGSRQIVSGLHTYACRPLIDFAPGFLGQTLNSHHFHTQVVLKSQGSKVSSINKPALSTTEVVYPSLPEQQAIGAYFRSLDALIDAEQKKLDTLRNLKSALLTQMFV